MTNPIVRAEPTPGLEATLARPPGRYTFVLRVPLVEGESLPIPVYVIRGQRSGPVLLVGAGEHGSELNGVAAIDRVFRGTAPRDLCGTFIGIPAINPGNIRHRGFPEGEYGVSPWDSFRTWPGDPQGTPAERLAATLVREVVAAADVVINIHAWSWYSASCAFTTHLDPRAMQLARAFGLGFVCFKHSGYGTGTETPPHPRHNMLTHYALSRGKLAMLVELRTQHWLYPPSVAAGITGIRNVMQALGMLPGRPVLPETQYEACEEEIVDAPCGGLFVPVKEIGDAVRRNAVLGYLLDLETGRQTAVRSPCTGAVWLVSRVGKSGNYVSDLDAYAERGDMLALIKHVKRLTR